MWFRKKQPSKTLNVILDGETLHGVSLSEFHYLGFTIFEFTGESTYKYHAHFFISDSGKRRVSITTNFQGDTYYKYHKFYEKVTLWAVGEGELYHRIRNPSRYLKDYMAKKFSASWDSESGVWVDMNYETAVQKQNSTTQNVTKIGNVIKLNFKE